MGLLSGALSPLMGLFSAFGNDRTDKKNYQLNERMYADQQRRQAAMDVELDEARMYERFRRREVRPGEEAKYIKFARGQLGDPGWLGSILSAFGEKARTDQLLDAGLGAVSDPDVAAYSRQLAGVMPGVNQYNPAGMNALYQTQLMNQTGGVPMRQHSGMMNTFPSSLYMLSQNMGRGGYDGMSNLFSQLGNYW